MLKVIDDVVKDIEKRADEGLIALEDIPFSLLILAKTVHSDMENEFYGNHFSADVGSSLVFLKRLCLGETYENGKVPVMYFKSFQTAAEDWSKRCFKTTGKLPVERKDIKPLVLDLQQYSGL